MSRYTAGVLDHPCQVHQIPCHESRVTVRKLVLWPARPWIEIGRTGTGLTKPIGVGLRRDQVANVLQRITKSSSDTDTSHCSTSSPNAEHTPAHGSYAYVTSSCAITNGISLFHSSRLAETYPVAIKNAASRCPAAPFIACLQMLAISLLADRVNPGPSNSGRPGDMNRGCVTSACLLHVTM